MRKSSEKPKLCTFIPESEKDSETPFTVYYTPLNKGAYDRYVGKITEIKKGQITTKNDKASEILFEMCLTANSEGIFIRNVEYNGTEYKGITDKKMAVNVLLGMEDVDLANDIDLAMRGQSSVAETDEKNSEEQ